MRTLRLLLPLVLATLPLAPALAADSGIVVVRHAEKADDGTRDPGLTSAGHERAQKLAEALDQADVGGLIASQYQRTQQTLAVMAAKRNLEVTIVPAEPGGDIEAHVQALVSQVEASRAEGLLVIAGHSNTVPLIVEALTGKTVGTISESDYDRMYLLLPDDAGMDVIVSRYGAADEAPAGSPAE